MLAILGLLQDVASTLENSFRNTHVSQVSTCFCIFPSRTQPKLLPATRHSHLARGPAPPAPRHSMWGWFGRTEPLLLAGRDRNVAQEDTRSPATSRMGLLRCSICATHPARGRSTSVVCSHLYFVPLNLWRRPTFLQLEHLVPNHILLEWHFKSLFKQ